MTPAHPIVELLRKRRLRVLGVNSGTSLDGLDAALVEIDNRPRAIRYKTLATFSRAFPRQLRGRLSRLASSPLLDKRTAFGTHFLFGDFIADSVRKWISRGPVDLIASHGQTVAHYPYGRTRSTWQVGALNAVAQRTECVVVGDFRPADIAAGGMGAPLSGYYHHLLFGPGTPVLNIGGIANISVSRPVGRTIRIVAFDTGPGNMIIDAVSQNRLRRAFDRGGRTAARGRVDSRLMAGLLRHPYFRLLPPKTCGREEFGWEQVKGQFERHRITTEVALSTAVEVTAWSIADSVRRWIAPHTRARRLVVTGGGAQNRYLVSRIADYLGDWTLADAEQWGVPSRHLEPVGFAVLAFETLHARPGNLGGGTGASQPAVLGLIALPPTLS